MKTCTCGQKPKRHHHPTCPASAVAKREAGRIPCPLGLCTGDGRYCDCAAEDEADQAFYVSRYGMTRSEYQARYPR